MSDRRLSGSNILCRRMTPRRFRFCPNGLPKSLTAPRVPLHELVAGARGGVDRPASPINAGLDRRVPAGACWRAKEGGCHASPCALDRPARAARRRSADLHLPRPFPRQGRRGPPRAADRARRLGERDLGRRRAEKMPDWSQQAREHITTALRRMGQGPKLHWPTCRR